MHNLRTKILLFAIALVVIGQLTTMGMVMYTAKINITKQAIDAVDKKATLLTGVSSSQANLSVSRISAQANDSDFIRAVENRNIYTINNVISNPKTRVTATMSLVIEDSQQIITQFGEKEILPEQVRKLVSNPAFKEGLPVMMQFNDSTYFIISAPIGPTESTGWLGMAYAMDMNYVDRVEQMIGLQISMFSIEDRSNPKLLISSLPPSDYEDLTAHIKQAIRLKGQTYPEIIEIGKASHLATVRPFVHQQKDIMVIVSEPMDVALATYSLIHKIATALTLIPLFIALLAAFMLSRTLTNPLKQLMRAAERIQVGNYDQAVRIDTKDELNEFVQAFNVMQSEISAREERTAYQAKHDGLTGLYNRDYAMENLRDSIKLAHENDEKLAVMMVSLNARQEISSTLGHEVADNYLEKAAIQVKSFIGEKPTIARLEIDTFLIILNRTNIDGATDIAQDFLARISSGIKFGDINVAVSPHIGIAVYPDHGDTCEQLILRSSIAKSEGTQDKRPISIYREGDEEQRVRNMTLLHDLLSAVTDNSLIMHYQPKINVADETVCGVEALIRWDHPTYGWLQPNEFVPIIEQSGNISILTRWALEAVAEQYDVWLGEGLDLDIAVNLSAHDIQDHELPWFIMDILRNHKLPPEKLIVEITEQAMVLDFSNATTVLTRLRDLGIKISIDDFGTGYSSLSQLKKLPVDELKIDRSFIAALPNDREDAAIVSTAIDLAHKLKLDIVAEGVTNRASYRWLQAHGIDRAQGYYWNKPIPAKELSSWISSFKGGSTQYLRALDFGTANSNKN